MVAPASKKGPRFTPALLVLFLSLLGGCGGGHPTEPPVPPLDPPPLASVPDTLRIGGQSFYLSCNIVRNLMPGGGLDDRLQGAISLIEGDSLAIADPPLPTRAWLFHGTIESWEHSFPSEPIPCEPYCVHQIFHGGPRWPCDVGVDVILELKMVAGGYTYVRRRYVQIECTS